MTGRGGRRCKQLRGDLEETKGYWKLKEEALHCSLWKTGFGLGYGPVVRQTTNQLTNVHEIWYEHPAIETRFVKA